MNINKLKGKIKEAGMSQAELALKMGISQNSLSRKINNVREFTLAEVVTMMQLLGINDPKDIFFDLGVPITQRKEVG